MAYKMRFKGLRYDPKTHSWQFKRLTYDLKKRSLSFKVPKRMVSRTAEFVAVLVVGMILSALIASEYLGIGFGLIFISAGVIMAGAIIAVVIYYLLKSPVQEGVRSLHKRRRFSPELKRELLEKQDGKCMYCGDKPRIDLMDIDHKYPIARGGSNHKRNLQVLCRSCNGRKGEMTDRKFRDKFESIGVPETQVPPAKRILQSKFEKVAQETTAKKAEQARARRRRRRDAEWP